MAFERFLDFFEDPNEGFFLLRGENNRCLSCDPPDYLGNILEITSVTKSLEKNTHSRICDFFGTLHGVDVVLLALCQDVQDNLLRYFSALRAFQTGEEFLKLQNKKTAEFIVPSEYQKTSTC